MGEAQKEAQCLTNHPAELTNRSRFVWSSWFIASNKRSVSINSAAL
ncbi:MAG TPA: hypothetical protein VLE46_17740 [Nitrospira sp.]|jgi:hypothetical protein|nr:hypothetical protein [Nitrospira sp.]